MTLFAQLEINKIIKVITVSNLTFFIAYENQKKKTSSHVLIIVTHVRRDILHFQICSLKFRSNIALNALFTTITVFHIIH